MYHCVYESECPLRYCVWLCTLHFGVYAVGVLYRTVYSCTMQAQMYVSLCIGE